jgi:topoisomerase-4 subunit B
MFARGKPLAPLQQVAPLKRGQKGTAITFHPDPEIFGEGAAFKPRGCCGWRVPRPTCSAA